MPKTKVARKCKICGTSKGHISNNSLCMDCAVKNIHRNIKEMQSKEGENYAKWLVGMEKAILQAKKDKAEEHKSLDNFVDKETK